MILSPTETHLVGISPYALDFPLMENYLFNKVMCGVLRTIYAQVTGCLGNIKRFHGLIKPYQQQSCIYCTALHSKEALKVPK